MNQNETKTFKKLCEFFNAVKQKPASEKVELTKRTFEEWKQNRTGSEMFPLLRLILPKLDRERQSYNMKEAKIVRVLIKMLALPAGHDKTLLTKRVMPGQASDFADVVYCVIRKYIRITQTTLTIDELNNNLDDMANRSNEGEAEEILIKLFKKCSPEDTRWIIRILLKDLKLGIDGNRILNCYHKDGTQYFASNNSLKKVSEVLYDKTVNVHELDIQLFEAFRPMLSKRVDGTSFTKDFRNNELYFVENKFDGERFQLHMENDTFKYFSRNGFDFTEKFGSSYQEGIFTPKLKHVFSQSVQRIILDGEMMLWNKTTKKYGSKGMELDVKKLNENGKYQPCFCVYDIILLNNNVLTNKPLKERASILKKVIQQSISGTLVLSKIKEVHTYEEIINELNISAEKEEEGIIVKDPNSVYKYSDRSSGWFKIKLEFFQDTMNDLDVIVMGGQCISISGEMNSFMIGVRSDDTETGRPVYLSFGKVTSGLKDTELDMLNKKLKEQGRPFNNKHSPSLLFGKETPNYYIEPEHSLLFELRASELIRCTDNSYRTPYTVRFPRVMQIRYDKPVYECLSMNELLELTNKNKNVIKLNKSKLELEEIMKTKTRTAKKRKVFVPDFSDRRQISDVLEDYIIYVFNGNEEKSKDDIEKFIKKAGGEAHYRVDNTVDIVLVGTYNEKVKQLSSKRNHYDIVNVNWFYRVLQDGNLLGYETEEIYCLGTNPKNCLSDEVDRYGDSYVQDATIQSMKHSFEIMSNLNEVPSFGGLLQQEGRKNFSSYNAYFDKYITINDLESENIYDSFLDELEFRYYKGKICRTINDETNLVIVEEDKREAVLKDYLKSINREDIEIQDKKFIYI